MKGCSEFDQRTGRVTVPMAGEVPRSQGGAVEHHIEELKRIAPIEDFVFTRYRKCTVSPRQGCYALTFKPGSTFPVAYFPLTYRGTLRFEEVGPEVVVSADLYRFSRLLPLKAYDIPAKYTLKWGHDTAGIEEAERIRGPRDFVIEAGKLKRPPWRRRIPIYARRRYHAYLQGVSAQLTRVVSAFGPCSFSLTFDEFVYQHPATGFDGSFPATPDRRLTMELEETESDHTYTGRLLENGTDLGRITLEWLSPHFRRASLEVNRLEGAVIPQPVAHPSGTGTEDFSTIFATAGWDLRVTRDDDAIELPGTLEGVQEPASCWNPDFDRMHDLMDSLPGYDPDDLDTQWKAHLVAIPATLGCSRGWMFDAGSGDVNDIAREGAVTHSHDGYPSTDFNTEYGTAEDDLQKDHPRAFLRSAAHEVGHTFNQIHQNFEGGSDNSIMTVTPSVSRVLDDAGEEFPDDIDLAFNDTVRRHLIHLPDPAVRPGAMGFFGTAVSAPEADVHFFDADDLEVTLELKPRVKLGEPVQLHWTVTNRSGESLPLPERLDADSEVARISVTNAAGAIRFMKAFTALPCSRNQVSALKSGGSREAEANLFWSRNGFAFESPGRHVVELILLWQVKGLPVGARGRATVWVDHPVTEKDNEVAALMLDEEVGKLVASGGGRRYAAGHDRVEEVLKKHPRHPACKGLRGMLDR